jgi:DNA-binding MarR family transcriptional regulator
MTISNNIDVSLILDALAGRVSEKIIRPFNRAFTRESPVTMEQYLVLSCLLDKDNITQQTLCNLTNKDKPSITRLIDKLEAKDLVKRVSDKVDRRKKHVLLTQAGRTACQKTEGIVLRIAGQAVGNIDEYQLNTFQNVLQNIVNNLAPVGLI